MEQTEAVNLSGTDVQKLQKRIRFLILFFMAALAVSGITAIPLIFEIGILNKLFGVGTGFASVWPAMSEWVSYVYEGLTVTNQNYPFIAYGTDWLAFAHIMIAIAFIGPLRDPVRNIWVIEFGMIACVLLIPLALVFGPIRGIPFVWRMIDCSFGVFGIIPLWFIRRDIQQLSLQN